MNTAATEIESRYYHPNRHGGGMGECVICGVFTDTVNVEDFTNEYWVHDYCDIPADCKCPHDLGDCNQRGDCPCVECHYPYGNERL